MSREAEAIELLDEIKTAAGKSQRDVFYYIKADQALALLQAPTSEQPEPISPKVECPSCGMEFEVTDKIHSCFQLNSPEACPSGRPTDTEELKFTLHNKTHEVVGYLRLKNGWTQFATKDKPDQWVYPCPFKWNHHHCDIIDRQAGELERAEDLEAITNARCTRLHEQIKQRIEIIGKMTIERGKLQAELEKYRWIPVSERLPENANAVLLYCDKMIATGYFSGEWQIHNTKTPRGYYQHKITHWKPIILPEQALNLSHRKGG